VTENIATLGRRDRRKLEARTRLLAAARQVIARHGIANLRISDVTEMADIGSGTFYSHFESKEAIVEAVVTEAVTSFAEAIGTEALEREDPAETASISYRRFVRLAAEEAELAGILVNIDHAEALFESALLPYARETLERGIRGGRFQIDNVELCLTSVSAAALAAMRAVLSGRVGPGADIAGAEMILRSFGVDVREAKEIANRPLPEPAR